MMAEVSPDHKDLRDLLGLQVLKARKESLDHKAQQDM
jgi:hypothetical protein